MQELHRLSIPLRDGVRLAADVFVPDSPSQRPAIVEITPYGRGPNSVSFRYEAEHWVGRGYVFAIVDARGQGESEGTFAYFHQEGEDGYDVVEWLAVQPWCNGRVGMRGSSYSGTNQWYTARLRPPHLRCITPDCVAALPFDDMPYPGGTFMFGWALGWLSNLPQSGIAMGTQIDWRNLLAHKPLATADIAAFGHALPLYRGFASHTIRDAYWQPLVITPDEYAAMTTPSLAFSGWFDGTLTGTVRRFCDASAASAVPGAHRLIVGPWQHMNAPDGGVDYLTGEPLPDAGNFHLPRHAFIDGRKLVDEFFDQHLRDGPPSEEAPVRLYLTGSNRWIESHRYPPSPVDPTPMYLHGLGSANGLTGDGRLSAAPPGDEPADHFLNDPMNPVSSTSPGGPAGHFTLSGSPIDLAPLIDRPDVLVYLSEPMAVELTVVGRVLLVLIAATDGLDTDFMAHLEDIDAAGVGTKLGSQNGASLRARLRNGPDREELLTPDVPERFVLDFFDIGHTFMPGHRIRLSVMSTAYPFTFPNPNTGLPIADDVSPPRVARQTVFHDQGRASHLLLPVLRSNAPG